MPKEQRDKKRPAANTHVKHTHLLHLEASAHTFGRAVIAMGLLSDHAAALPPEPCTAVSMLTPGMGTPTTVAAISMSEASCKFGGIGVAIGGVRLENLYTRTKEMPPVTKQHIAVTASPATKAGTETPALAGRGSGGMRRTAAHEISKKVASTVVET